MLALEILSLSGRMVYMSQAHPLRFSIPGYVCLMYIRLALEILSLSGRIVYVTVASLEVFNTRIRVSHVYKAIYLRNYRTLLLPNGVLQDWINTNLENLLRS